MEPTNTVEYFMNTKTLRYIFINRWSAFLHDLIWIILAIVLAYWFRYNLESIPQVDYASLGALTAIAVPVQGSVFWIFHLYRGFWRFASVPDLIRILKAVGLGTVIVTAICALATRFNGVPRSVFFLYPMLLVGGMSISRIMYRWLKSKSLNLSAKEGRRTLIVGAGNAGELLVRDLIQRPEYQPVAFVDDDSVKYNRDIHGVRVIGKTSELISIIQSLSIELVVLAIPSADKETVKNMVDQCNQISVACQTLPSVFEMAGAGVDASRLRQVTVEDLLGRDPVHLDIQAISGYLQEKVVMISGGGGSIGSELCRQVAAQNPKMLIVYDNGEFNLYSIDHELREKFPALKLESILGDVKDVDRINWTFKTFSPDVIFHAAAYKHVPMVEMNPAEGVNNNICGTRVVADAADFYGAERFVMISTDKAVNPANVMGATKRVAEIYCQNLAARSQTRFITTRFGNVLGSAGSVVPLFQKQIENGGPVTVTHKNITRYFMTIPESVSLILQAGSMGKGGEIFVLDMGEPVMIRNLAEQMIRLSGFVPGEDIEIIYTGLRPGEKLYEEIFHESENLKSTDHPKLLLARSREVEWEWLLAVFDKLQAAANSRQVETLKEYLHNIVPEFQVHSDE